MRKFLIALVLFFFIFLGLIYAASSRVNQATPFAVRDMAPNEEIITLKTSDGYNIKASYVAGACDNSPAILFLHGNGARRDRFITHFREFNRASYAVMAIDFRGHGESDDAEKSYGIYESIDAHTAFGWLKDRQDDAKIGVVGVSLGGAAALIGEAGPLRADAMVLQAVFPDIRRAIGNRTKSLFGSVGGAMLEPFLSYQSIIRYGVWPSDISPVDAAKRYKGASLVIGGGNDQYTPAGETYELQNAINVSGKAWILDGYGHRGASGVRTDEYFDRTIGFFDQHLTPEPC